MALVVTESGPYSTSHNSLPKALNGGAGLVHGEGYHAPIEICLHCQWNTVSTHPLAFGSIGTEPLLQGLPHQPELGT